MRLDKFLKVSRLIKRRTVAKDICDAGRISINGKTAKAASEVKVGDVLTIGYGSKRTEAEVLLLAESMKADLADTMYKIIGETRIPLDE